MTHPVVVVQKDLFEMGHHAYQVVLQDILVVIVVVGDFQMMEEHLIEGVLLHVV
jgi:hypothetical protein